MRRLIWIKWGEFDVSLDRTTWLEMARCLRAAGVETTIVTTYRHAPLTGEQTNEVVWVPSRGRGAFRLVHFCMTAWSVIMSRALAGRLDYVIVSPMTFGCAFPLDALSRAGFRHEVVLMDLRTFDFGGGGPSASRRDPLLRLITALALRYGGRFHAGVSTITRSLAEAAATSHAHPRSVVWGSGCRRVRDGQGVLPSDLAAFLEHPFVLAYHGAIEDNRGLSLAIDAMRMVANETEGVVLAIVGSGRAAPRLQQRIVKLGLRHRVRIFAPIPHSAVPSLLSHVKMGVMLYPEIPYWTYNQPIKALEYLSAGVPLLCTRTPVFLKNLPQSAALVPIQRATAECAAAEILRWSDDLPGLASRGRSGPDLAGRYSWARHARRLSLFLSDLRGRGGV